MPETVPEQDVATGYQALLAATTTFIDVREPDEWADGHIPGARHIPLASLPDAVATLPPGPLLMVCRVGGRSHRATRYLHAVGRTDAVNLAGGMVDWAAAGFPVITD